MSKKYANPSPWTFLQRTLGGIPLLRKGAVIFSFAERRYNQSNEG
jgi:hypothetical protein